MTTSEYYFKEVFQTEYFFYIKQDEIYGDIFDTYFRFYKQCSTYEDNEMLNSNFTRKIKREFDEKCHGNNTCNIHYDFMDLNKQCLDEVFRRSKSSFNS